MIFAFLSSTKLSLTPCNKPRCLKNILFPFLLSCCENKYFRDWLLCFRQNTISCTCFEKSGLNSIHYWSAHWYILVRSSLRVSVVNVGSRTPEKKGESSAKTFEYKLFTKSFINEPTGTAALSFHQYDDWPLRAILWYRLFKKECINPEQFSIFPVASVYALAFHARIYQMLWISPGIPLFCNGVPQFLDSGRCTLDSGLWTLEAGLWTLDTGLWKLDSGRWALDCGF